MRQASAPRARFPGQPGKHLLASATDPAEHAEYVRARCGPAGLSGAGGAVLLYQRSLRAYALMTYVPQARDHWIAGDLHLVARAGRCIALCSGFGRGAPAAGLVTEQLGALGIRNVISVGTAAALFGYLTPGTIVVCAGAVRDEGLSHHYLPPGRYVRPSPGLTAALAAGLAPRSPTARHGPTWTTDAPYRETREEITRYRRAGVLTCDMEAAGIFAVARHRGINAAAAFCVADSLLIRAPRSRHPDTAAGLQSILDAAIQILLDTGPPSASLAAGTPGTPRRAGPS
jgi:uridine phosphorylase